MRKQKMAKVKKMAAIQPQKNIAVKSRKSFGKLIMKGLLKPGFNGGPVIVGAYNQGDGGYWQSDGDTHVQGSGDYHQG